MKKIKGILSVAAVLVLGFSGIAFAVPCIQGAVSGSSYCQDGVVNNDYVSNPLTVNTENFFGFNDWQYLQKQNIGGTLETMMDYDWTVTGSGQTGTWAFDSSLWNYFTDVMIVVKNGNNKPSNVFFSGYLLDSLVSSGGWDTGDKDLSHLALYARGETPPVPEPGTILLLGAGLAGLVFLRKKSR